MLALWFVCGLGTTALAAVAPRSRGARLAFAAGVLAGAWSIRQPLAPSPPAIAVAAAFVAALELTRTPRLPFAMAAAGLLAGIWTGVLERQGLPVLAAAAVAVTLPLGSAYLAMRRPSFAPVTLRDEALLFLVILGIVAAAAPGIADGWRAAGSLNLRTGDAGPSETVTMPWWTLGTASAALLSGALVSLWSRR